MKRYIELVTIAIIFAAVAVSLGGYALGLGPLGVSDVVAQEDHDDGGDDRSRQAPHHDDAKRHDNRLALAFYLYH